MHSNIRFDLYVSPMFGGMIILAGRISIVFDRKFMGRWNLLEVVVK